MVIRTISDSLFLQGDEFVKVNVTVECDGDKQLTKPDTSNTVTQPLLTEQETDANYRYASPLSSLGTGFVVWYHAEDPPLHR